MPSLIGITNIINASLQADPFNTQKFQGGSWNGIAEFVYEEIDGVRMKRPTVISEDGDGSDVMVNDTYPMVVYHRIASLTYENEDDWDFGDPNMIKREIANMIMIVFGDRSRLNVTSEDMVATIAANMPASLSSSQYTALQIISAEINVGQPTINKQEVFDQEYEGSEYNLKTNSIFVSIPYTITTSYSKNCFNICN